MKQEMKHSPVFQSSAYSLVCKTDPLADPLDPAAASSGLSVALGGIFVLYHMMLKTMAVSSKESSHTSSYSLLLGCYLETARTESDYRSQQSDVGGSLGLGGEEGGMAGCLMAFHCSLASHSLTHSLMSSMAEVLYQAVGTYMG